MSDNEKRINKYLADKGLCSRREAEELIKKGWVSVNGVVLDTLGYKVKAGDRVTVANEVQSFLSQKLTVLINKPMGYVSAQAEDDYEPAIRLTTPENFFGRTQPPTIGYQGFAPAGRLDIDSTGLLILTQNGKLAKKIIAADSEVEKEYWVNVKGHVSDTKINQLCHGLFLDEKQLKPAIVSLMNEGRLKFILKEGRKRQIRRMCEQVDLQVTGLKRVRVGDLNLGKLPNGMWRILRPNEKI